jgi:hypothetical protein
LLAPAQMDEAFIADHDALRVVPFEFFEDVPGAR